MSFPTLTASSTPNPTIGSNFATGATVNNTLLTAIKSDFTAISDYITVTGIENAYLQAQSVKSPQVNLKAGFGAFGSGTTALSVGVNTTVSDTITIAVPSGITDPFISLDFMFALRGTSSSVTSFSLWVERDVSSSFTSPVIVQNIQPSCATDTFTASGQTLINTLTLVDKPGANNTYYYRARAISFTATATGVFRGSSFYKYLVLNSNY